MKFAILVLPLFVTSVHALVDRDRADQIFSPGVRANGKYVDSFEITSDIEMDILGQVTNLINKMDIENTVVVTDLRDGSHAIDVEVTSFHYSMEGLPTGNIECDSEEDTDSEICDSLYDVIFENHHFTVDDKGKIASQTTSVSTQHSASKVHPDKQLLHTSRNLEFIPTHAVAPGETWTVETEDEFGSFTGTATLDGYKEQDGHDCAVITVSGKLQVNMEALMDEMQGLGVGDMDVTDAVSTATIVWDNEMKLARWSEFSQSFTLTVENPFDHSKMTLPVHQEFTMTSKEA